MLRYLLDGRLVMEGSHDSRSVFLNCFQNKQADGDLAGGADASLG